MRYDRTVIGYHGCDREIAERLLDGEPFKPSENDYDWLGSGVYFWEYGADRAMRFARLQQRRGKIEAPAVVGALIQLGRCFDLLDTRFMDDLAEAYETLRSGGVELPENRGDTPDKLLRFRDCAVMSWYLDNAELEGEVYDTVRCCFQEGGPVFDGSGIRRESHIQLVVRRPECVLGVFRPHPERYYRG